jgi:hypothetical protein
MAARAAATVDLGGQDARTCRQRVVDCVPEEGAALVRVDAVALLVLDAQLDLQQGGTAGKKGGE